MAGLTFAQTVDLTTDTLQKGVIETMATESKLLAVLPFMTVEGHGYTYNVEKSLAGVEFRKVNDSYNTVAPTTERRAEYLTILGGEAVVDSFQMEVHSNINDLMAIEVALTSKAIAHKYEKTFLNGDSAVDANSFNGLIKRVTAVGGAQVIAKGNLVDDLDVMLDNVLGGADALIMNKKTRRGLTAAARSGQITYVKNNFGVQVMQYGDIDVIDVEADLLADDIVLAVKFGVGEAVAGLQSKSGIMVKPLGELGESPQLKTRIEWFAGLAVFNDKAVAMRKATA
ncbi:major capsid protein [Bacillus sp. NPDC077027]|uniref:major capsid protein n=1 Tax=Bacillus sp. NPDC077027 TaxID=3390548 RepID=UPI003D08CF24